MLTLSVEIEGTTVGDLTMAIGEVRRLVEQGFLSGANSNDDGSYSFTRSGEIGADEEGADDKSDK